MIDLARHAQVQFGLALVALLVCIGALAWRNVFGRPLAPDLVLPAALARVKLSARWRARLERGLDLGLALIALALAGLFMTMTGVHGRGLDHQRVLHEVVQAKYHGELGWDRLYACAWAADRDHEGYIEGVETIRELELEPAPAIAPTPEPIREVRRVGEDVREVTVERPERPEPPPDNVGGRLRPASALARDLDCRARFGDARWDALAADVGLVTLTAPPGTMPGIFQGYGSTASPARLARQRLLFAVLPVAVGSLFVLGLLGGLLTLAALFAVERGFGLRAAALVGIVCFVEFAASPLVSGASTANALVLAAALAALALVELERFVAAGALLAFAALDAGWPALILLALLAKLAADWFAGEDGRKQALARVAAGAAGCGAALLLLSLSLPGGLANWSIWLDRLAVTRYAEGTHQVGLRWMFTPDGSWLGGPAELDYPTKALRLADRRGWFLICAALLSLPPLLAIRRLPAPAFAAIVGVTATFALLSTHATAWSVALPLMALAAAAIGAKHADSAVLVGRPATLLVAGCLGICVAMHGIARIHLYAPWLFNMIYSHLLTTLLLGLGATLLLVPGLRERGDPPGAPASVPVLDPASASKSKSKSKTDAPEAEIETEQAAAPAASSDEVQP